MASIKLKGDTSGEVTISAPSVAGTTTLELPATSSTLATQNSLGVRNLIINGDMRIAQRGTSFAISTGAMQYGLDRWAGRTTPSTGLFTVSQSSDAPTGFQKSLLATVTSTYMSSVTSSSSIRHYIEGYNTAHLDWGTANAKTVTLSFWVKSSVTGNFGGAFRNESANYSYPFLYTVSSANTWEKISVTIAGATSGSWATTSGSGIQVLFSLGTGEGLIAPANSWIASDNHGADGQVQLIETSGATWQITGVQLEVGTEATPFEHKPYDMELARCQRYFSRLGSGVWGLIYSGSNADVGVQFPITMRSTPSVSHLANYQITLIATAEYTVTNTIINPSASNSVNGIFVRLTSTGMSSGNCCISAANNIGFSAEL